MLGWLNLTAFRHPTRYFTTSPRKLTTLEHPQLTISPPENNEVGQTGSSFNHITIHQLTPQAMRTCKFDHLSTMARDFTTLEESSDQNWPPINHITSCHFSNDHPESMTRIVEFERPMNPFKTPLCPISPPRE
jgi:hypothetical protein